MLTPELMARVVMENYDPNFASMFRQGDILVGGYNFGCGSSREQAATTLKSSGIDVVIAGSFSETYKRNAFNNGLLCIEIPELVSALRTEFGTDCETVRTNRRCKLDFRTCSAAVSFDGDEYSSFSFHPLGPVAQALIVAGSLEQLIIARA